MDKTAYDKFIKASKHYRDARKNMITLVVLTVINLFLLPATGIYFVFSISMSAFGLLTFAPGTTEFVVVIVYSVVLVAAYLVFAILSKKHYWAMIVLLVMFALDSVFTILIIFDNSFFPILDFIFHILYLISLVNAVIGGKTLKDNFDSGIMVTDSEITALYRKENAKAANLTTTKKGPSVPQKDIFGYDLHTETGKETELRCRCCGAPRKSQNAQFCEYCGAPFIGRSNDSNNSGTNEKPKL